MYFVSIISTTTSSSHWKLNWVRRRGSCLMPNNPGEMCHAIHKSHHKAFSTTRYSICSAHPEEEKGAGPGMGGANATLAIIYCWAWGIAWSVKRMMWMKCWFGAREIICVLTECHVSGNRHRHSDTEVWNVQKSAMHGSTNMSTRGFAGVC